MHDKKNCTAYVKKNVDICVKLWWRPPSKTSCPVLPKCAFLSCPHPTYFLIHIDNFFGFDAYHRGGMGGEGDGGGEITSSKSCLNHSLK